MILVRPNFFSVARILLLSQRKIDVPEKLSFKPVNETKGLEMLSGDGTRVDLKSYGRPSNRERRTHLNSVFHRLYCTKVDEIESLKLSIPQSIDVGRA